VAPVFFDFFYFLFFRDLFAPPRFYCYFLSAFLFFVYFFFFFVFGGLISDYFSIFPGPDFLFFF